MVGPGKDGEEFIHDPNQGLDDIEGDGHRDDDDQPGEEVIFYPVLKAGHPGPLLSGS
jgi:hypothetical protein